MERRDRKRKAQEISDSPQFVSQTITELTSVLAERDAVLLKEISELRDDVGKLEKLLKDKKEECSRLEAEVAFFHPDAIIDRIRMKLWHSGDLTILRRAIHPQSRVLRSTDTRGDRYLFLSDAPAKRSKPANTAKATELSPKHEDEEVTTSVPATKILVITTNTDDGEEKQQEDEDFNHQQEDDCVPPAVNSYEAMQSPQQEITNGAVAEPFPEIDAMNNASMSCAT
ncbi:hypothetical protein PC121_g20678 [Phytophthora cactorum]|nr:hypothetical protein PC120_g21444 [Phytophthora cactorum]KAG3046422.1 hypothetical protein PC121_g20678 [Phytophthora cactorum]